MTHQTNRRTLLAAGLALAASHAYAQPDPGLVRVVLKTGKGVIGIDLNLGKAPITAHNFLHYVDLRKFDGVNFYRASRSIGAPEFGTAGFGMLAPAYAGGLPESPGPTVTPLRVRTVSSGLPGMSTRRLR